MEVTGFPQEVGALLSVLLSACGVGQCSAHTVQYMQMLPPMAFPCCPCCIFLQVKPSCVCLALICSLEMLPPLAFPCFPCCVCR
jgi:hypothetical protein